MTSESKLDIVVQARDEASASLNKLNSTLSGLENTTKKSDSSFKGLVGSFALGNLAAGAAQKAFGFLKDELVSVIHEAQESQNVQAQLAAVLKSTGGAAGVTADMVNATSESLKQVTTYGDEAITSVQSLLLTFTNIGKNVLPNATESVLDMATAMGTDTKSAAIQLGKALNDPITGITALTRVGVTFNDEQKRTIERLMETGKGMEAQKIILAELSKEFGGSARAAAETFDGRMQQLNNSIGDIKENIGKALLPALTLFVTDASKAANSAAQATNKNDTWARAFYSVASAVRATGLTIKALIETMGLLVVAVGETGMILWKLFSHDFKGAMDQAKSGADLLAKMAKTVGSAFANVGGAIKEGVIQNGFKPVQDASSDTAKKLFQDFGGAEDKVRSSAERMKKAMESFSDKAKDVQNTIAEIIKDYTKKSGDQLDAYNKKVADINKSISEIDAKYAKDTADAKQKYQDDAVASYIEHQQKIIDIQKDIADKQKRITEGSGNAADIQNDINDLQKNLEDQKRVVTQYTKEFADIDKLASAEKSRTDLDKLKDAYLKDQKERDLEHTQKIADLQAKLEEEKQVYAKQKAELIADTADKYVKLNEELQKGWDKMIEDTKGKVKSMKDLESQVMAIKSAIESARASMGLAPSSAPASPPQKRAGGGVVDYGQPYIVGEKGPELFMPRANGTILNADETRSLRAPTAQSVNIKIMEGANVTITNEADEMRLVQRISSELSKALQNQRLGLTTAI